MRLKTPGAGALLVAAVVGCGGAGAPGGGGAQGPSGRVQSLDGRAIPGAWVTLRDQAASVSMSVRTREDGSFGFREGWTSPRASAAGASASPALVDTSVGVTLTVRATGWEPSTEALPMGGGPVERTLSPGTTGQGVLRDRVSSDLLSLLPEGEQRRRFIVDCTGCHVLDATIVLDSTGAPRDAAGWDTAIRRMLGYAGPGSGFPIISRLADPSGDGAWLAEAFATVGTAEFESAGPASSPAEFTEYDVPVPADLPHDLVVDRLGQVLVTGMFTHRMYLLDPATGVWDTRGIPVERANPRAVDLDAAGDWWVLLGQPGAIARYRPSSDEWASFEIGMYPHSLFPDPGGRVWFNGHFTYAPERIGYVDAASGEVRTFEVPPSGGAGPESTIQYGLRVGPDGTVWSTQLRGNHLVRFDPDAETFRLYPMPRPHSGPRRPDVGPDGAVWIPEYGAGRLARFDPATESFREWDLPIPNSAPYVVRVDPERGRVWIGTGAADAVLRFDPATERFDVYRLPTRGALIRHIDVDDSNGDLWAAYGASPGIPSRVLRLRPTS